MGKRLEGSAAQAELHQQCPGSSLRTGEQLGKIWCLGKEVASSCLHPTVLMRSLYSFKWKELHQKCWSLLLISSLGKQLQGLSFV